MTPEQVVEIRERVDRVAHPIVLGLLVWLWEHPATDTTYRTRGGDI